LQCPCHGRLRENPARRALEPGQDATAPGAIWVPWLPL
jgi:hypothetical protein